MKLFIAEKPSLAQAIAAGIGVGKRQDGYISLNGGNEVVTWCYGHILEQLSPSEYDERYKTWSMSDLPIVPNPWRLKVKRELIGRAATIVNAGDPDREGQLLVDEILEYVGNKKPVQRILLNALDEKSVRQSLKNLKANDEFRGLKLAALGRSRADWLVGTNLSRAYTLKARQAGYESMSVGRVMTPTMALVVRREKEIAQFKSVTYYAVKAIFRNGAGDIPTIWKMSDTLPVLDSEGRLLDSRYAEEFVSGLSALPAGTLSTVLSLEEKTKQEPQRLPYSLSALQIEVGKKYGYSPQEVLNAMQSLYKKKLTTYPRSDCEYLPVKGFAALVDKADTSIRSRVWNDKKISAHHAIIPTRIRATFENLSEIERRLYLMVAQAYLAQFYPAYAYKSTKVVISFAEEKFVGKGRRVLEQGWKEIYGDSNHEETDESELALPKLTECESVNYAASEIKASRNFTRIS